ncbi:hypothetical protein [Amycolatopsis sp. GM8]|uniref:hypothetical protein n=1 Tax=Amycolatopsis sp. GM8 TaxID=2896530 RepID=UPI001F48864D|nr:hypothetical protein [Amycolatopsis sp. GM8]
MKLEGPVWKATHGLTATDLVPTSADRAAMRRDWAECARHTLADIDPGFTSRVQPGHLIIADGPVGTGHAHYHMAAIMGAKTAGIGAVLGRRVSPLFLRAAIDAGLFVWAFPDLPDFVATGDVLSLDLASGLAVNATTGARMSQPPVDPIIRDILAAGGCDAWARSRVAQKSEEAL